MMNIFDFSPKQLSDLLLDWKEPPYRANQIIEATWTQGHSNFSNVSSLTKSLRNQLDNYFIIPQPLKPERQLLDEDGTIKVLMNVGDNTLIESVAIPKNSRLTYCISTQAGCAMGCTFCATAELGLARHLASSEIISQIRTLNSITGRMPTNLVFMGMGEPLHNLSAVRNTLALITHPKAMNWSAQKSMISTCGYLPGIQSITNSPLPAKLAVSLNAANNTLRNELMPINKKYPIEVLLPAIREYSKTTGQAVCIEYILLKNINDRIEDALLLCKLLKNYNVKINLIPYNHISKTNYQAPPDETITQFYNTVRKSGIVTTLRHSRGRNIQAACGQLAGTSKRSTP